MTVVDSESFNLSPIFPGLSDIGANGPFGDVVSDVVQAGSNPQLALTGLSTH
jgi:hypothetical protein